MYGRKNWKGNGAGGAPAPAYPLSRGLLQQQLHVVVLDAHRGVFLAPAGEDLQRLVQAVGGRHLVPLGPHLHGADDDLQLHALVHLGVPREVVGSPSPGGARRNS